MALKISCNTPIRPVPDALSIESSPRILGVGVVVYFKMAFQHVNVVPMAGSIWYVVVYILSAIHIHVYVYMYRFTMWTGC